MSESSAEPEPQLQSPPPSPHHRRLRLLRRHPSAFLLAAQLASLLVYGAIDDTRAGRWLFGTIAAVVVPLTVWVVNRTPAVTRVAWLLAIPAMLLTAIGIATDGDRWLAVSALLEALLYFYAAASLMAYMLRDHRVTRDELFAVGATFTLLAWGFAYAYFVCQTWFPGSFTGLEPERPRTWLELLFLSFTNLSSTGLSDVVPIRPMARALVMIEQLAGLAYVAFFVSRVVGLTLNRARSSAPAPREPASTESAETQG